MPTQDQRKHELNSYIQVVALQSTTNAISTTWPISIVPLVPNLDTIV
jgi:hypothetical protein